MKYIKHSFIAVVLATGTTNVSAAALLSVLQGEAPSLARC